MDNKRINFVMRVEMGDLVKVTRKEKESSTLTGTIIEIGIVAVPVNSWFKRLLFKREQAVETYFRIRKDWDWGGGSSIKAGDIKRIEILQRQRDKEQTGEVFGVPT